MKENTKKLWADPRVLLSLLLVLLIMAVIFHFSAQPVMKSSGTSDGYVTRLIKFFLRDFDSLPKAQQQLIKHRMSVFVRKTAHVLEYAALGFGLMLHIESLKRFFPLRSGWLWAWGIGTFYAATDEFHQFFVPGRGPRVSDVCIDCAGTILGVLFLLLCRRMFCRRKKEGRKDGNQRVLEFGEE